MTAKPLQIDGLVVDPDDVAQRYDGARERLEAELRSTKHALEDVTAERDRMTRTIRNLQTTLNPMYRALAALFGDIELAVGEAPMSNAGESPAASTTDPRWQSFKNSFPGVGAEIIDALLVHGQLMIMQLAKLTKHDYNTVARSALKLKDAGAVTYSKGTPVSLKR